MNQFKNFIQYIPLSANEYSFNQTRIRGANLNKNEIKQSRKKGKRKEKKKKTTDLLHPGLPLR